MAGCFESLYFDVQLVQVDDEPIELAYFLLSVVDEECLQQQQEGQVVKGLPARDTLRNPRVSYKASCFRHSVLGHLQ